MSTLTYHYQAPSELTDAGLQLSTSGGPAAHPWFFTGAATAPAQLCAGLLLVSTVAGTHYARAVGVPYPDPLVTADRDVLRFESVSLCAGVSARLDVLAAGLDGDQARHGTTNVDVGPQLRPLLATVRRRDPVRLDVGADGLTVSTSGTSVVERKVPLAERWLRALTEAQALTSGVDLRAELAPREAMAFLNALPTGARADVRWAVPTGRTLRLVERPQPGAVCLPGPHRLEVLRRFWRLGATVQAYGPPVTASSPAQVSVWVVSTPTARLSLTLSPGVWRSLSGEGAALERLAAGSAPEDADLVSALLAVDPDPEIDALAAGSGLTPGRVRDALHVLATSGQIGYDPVETRYFHRALPFDQGRVERANPRLAGARALVAAGAVTLIGDGARVLSGSMPSTPAGSEDADEAYLLRPEGNRLRCTCRWWTDHDGGRGPCKHELAVRISQADRPAGLR